MSKLSSNINCKKRTTHYSLLITHFFGFLLLSGFTSHSQTTFSLATDVSGLRNFSPGQKFWAIGQTVQANFHFTEKETMYVWLNYYSPGKFSNTFHATAKSPLTSPSTLPFTVKGTWNFREVSVGWKHFFVGAPGVAQGGINIYGTAGFGLMWVGAENVITAKVDTSLYVLPSSPVAGKDDFRRLTIDLGVGTEYAVGANAYFYVDVRTWIATTSYPSPLIHQNRDVPLPLIASLGLRIHFIYD